MAEFERVLVVDGNNILMKAIKVAYTGVELSAGGIPTASLLFFINSLARHVRRLRPDAVVVCWDGGRSKRRLALSPAYKAHRPSDSGEHERDFEMAADFLRLAGIQQQRRPGEEADDLVAAYTLNASAQQVHIVSDDHDLRQLIAPRLAADPEFTEVVQHPVSVKSADESWTYDRVLRHYGCTPGDLPYLMALMGDPGDGVQGLRGIGPKKGLKLLEKHQFAWPLLLDALAAGDRYTAELAYALVDLRHPPTELVASLHPLAKFEPVAYGSKEFAELDWFLGSLQMTSVLERLREGALWN